jgi:hypothetical protein
MTYSSHYHSVPPTVTVTANGAAGPAVAERVRRPGNEFVEYGGVTESPGTALR